MNISGPICCLIGRFQLGTALKAVDKSQPGSLCTRLIITPPQHESNIYITILNYINHTATSLQQNKATEMMEIYKQRKLRGSYSWQTTNQYHVARQHKEFWGSLLQESVIFFPTHLSVEEHLFDQSQNTDPENVSLLKAAHLFSCRGEQCGDLWALYIINRLNPNTF